MKATFNPIHRAIAVSVAVICTVMAAQANCVSMDTLKALGEKHFKTVENGPRYETSDDLKTSYVMPKAEECWIERITPKFSQFHCRWRVIKGDKNEASVRASYQAMVESMKSCVKRPDTVEMRKQRTRPGEITSMLDEFPGIKPTQQRYYEVSYTYSNYWWFIDLEYGVNDEVER